MEREASGLLAPSDEATAEQSGRELWSNAGCNVMEEGVRVILGITLQLGENAKPSHTSSETSLAFP